MRKCFRISEDKLIQSQWQMWLPKELMHCRTLLGIHPTESSLRFTPTALVSTKAPCEEPFQFCVVWTVSLQDAFFWRQNSKWFPQKRDGNGCLEASRYYPSTQLIRQPSLLNAYLLGLELGGPFKTVCQVSNRFHTLKDEQEISLRLVPLPSPVLFPNMLL